jgi:P27 family predicted phage terminase small subunit
MGSRGPASKPAEVHALFGDPSKLGAEKLHQLTKRAEVKAAPAPAFLGERARTEWRRIARELEKVGLVTLLDTAALAVYCQAYGEFVALEERIQELCGFVDAETLRVAGVEALLDIAPSGYRQIGALLQVRDRAADRMLKAAREFGLTPAARMRVLAVPQLPLFGDDEGDDPMSAFLKAGAGVAKVA